MRYWVISGLILMLVNISPAQYEFAFSGYVLAFPMYTQLHSNVAKLQGVDRTQILSITRLRLRPILSLWSEAELSMEYEITCLYNTSPVNQQIQAEQNQQQIVNLSATPVRENRWRLMHFIDRLQWRQGLSFGDFTIGRQRIAWGTGRMWNPTDLFNPLNPTTISKIEKDGVDAALLKISFSNFTDLSLVYNPQKNWNSSNTGFRFRTNFDEFDVSVMSGYFNKRIIIGGDFAGNLFHAGIRGEGIISTKSDNVNSNFIKLIIGADYQFTQELYGLVEYHFNGEGTLNHSAYNFTQLALGEILNVGRNYLAFSGSCLIHPLITISSSFISQLDDGSNYINISISVSVTDELAIAGGIQLFAGDASDEYWYFPDAVYLKADIYF